MEIKTQLSGTHSHQAGIQQVFLGDGVGSEYNIPAFSIVGVQILVPTLPLPQISTLGTS
jgi:hypothetical protein